VTLRLTAHGAGGHSSMPPPRSAIGHVSRAIDRLERDQFPARLDGASLGLFEAVAPEMTWPYRVPFANLWLFRPLVLRALIAAPSTAAAVRTTLAPTMLQAGIKENVLAPTAQAVINLRILPGETVKCVIERVRRVIDDTSVIVAGVGRGDEPSTVSPSDTAPFRAVAAAIRQIYADAIVAPFLVVGATDARHYAGLTHNVYRLAPLSLTGADLDRLHGVDERIAIADYLRAVRWYAQVIRLLTR
jgi:carboxypeptidase PM20D1